MTISKLSLSQARSMSRTALLELQRQFRATLDDRAISHADRCAVEENLAIIDQVLLEMHHRPVSPAPF